MQTNSRFSPTVSHDVPSHYPDGLLVPATASSHADLFSLPTRGYEESSVGEIIESRQTQPYNKGGINGELMEMLKATYEYHKATVVRGWLMKASTKNGDAVHFPGEYKGLPLLYDANNTPIPLYEIVGTIEGLVDYDDVQETFPALTYVQIARVFGFLRSVAQFNTINADIDKMEDKFIEADPSFQALILESIGQQENLRVLNAE